MTRPPTADTFFTADGLREYACVIAERNYTYRPLTPADGYYGVAPAGVRYRLTPQEKALRGELLRRAIQLERQ